MPPRMLSRAWRREVVISSSASGVPSLGALARAISTSGSATRPKIHSGGRPELTAEAKWMELTTWYGGIGRREMDGRAGNQHAYRVLVRRTSRDVRVGAGTSEAYEAQLVGLGRPK